MNHLNRLHELLPPIYTSARDSVLSQLLNVIALEMEIFEEDLDRMRQAHWIRFAYRLEDAKKIGALVGIEPFPWEDLRNFRERLLALVKARLQGALGPREIREFVYSYLAGAERVTGATLVPGLQSVTLDEAYRPLEDRPRFRPLALVENPPRRRRSMALAARGNRVPYLLTWEDTSQGLDESVVEFHLSAMPGKRPAVPVLVNRTTGDLIGYADRLNYGESLSVRVSPEASPDKPRLAQATLGGHDVTGKLFSLSGFKLGTPFQKSDLDAEPCVPRLARGVNSWIFLCVGLYDVPGLNRFFFAIADEDLREGVFDQTRFNHSLFPSGTLAKLELEWTEIEGASFEVHVPRYLVVEPAESDTEPLHERVAYALRSAISDLHAAGVRAEVRFQPFRESQPQQVRVQLPWMQFDPEKGPSGIEQELTFGGRYGESVLGGSRFE